MNRDSNTASVWQDLATEVNLKNKIDPEIFDVIIAGAGITGLTTGLLLQEAGLKCLILEARNIGFGTTSGTTAHLNTVLDTPYPDIISKFGEKNARLVAQAAKDAIALIKDNIDKHQLKCDFAYRDGYLFAETEKEVKTLEQISDALAQVGIEASYATDIPVPVPFLKAIRFPGQAQFHPMKYLYGLVEAFQNGGGTLRENARVEEADKKGELFEVKAGGRDYKSQSIVYATHIPLGINYLHFKCAPYRSYLLGLSLEDNNYPEALIYDMQDPYHYFRTVALDDEKILLVGGNDHKTGHQENTEYSFSELEAYVRKYYPVKEVRYRWSAQYYEPADGLPFIGHLPGGSDGAYVATGYSGNGMIFGSLAGRIITDLITKADNPYADLLSPVRIKPIASFKNFVRENADVVKHLVADRFSSDALETFSELSKEEGRVVKYQERQIAIYKDANGTLKALHPVCPHAGCIVQWNSVEKSWDCPCHGARYDVDGKLLNGPANSDLEQIDLE